MKNHPPLPPQPKPLANPKPAPFSPARSLWLLLTTLGLFLGGAEARGGVWLRNNTAGQVANYGAQCNTAHPLTLVSISNFVCTLTSPWSVTLTDGNTITPHSVSVGGLIFDPPTQTLLTGGAVVPTLDLTGLDPGPGTMVVTDPCGNMTTIGFNVVSCTSASALVPQLGYQNQIAPNRSMVFTIQVANVGPSPSTATTLEVTGILPVADCTVITLSAGMSVVNLGGSQKLTIPLGAISPGTQQAFSFTMQATPSAIIGTTFTMNAGFTSSYIYTDSRLITVVASIDPNIKSGPTGVGAAHDIAANTLLPYLIEFENDPGASAPAQIVTITDFLDTTKVEPVSFAFGPVHFGNQVVTPPVGVNPFSVTVPYDVDNNPLTTADNIYVRIGGSVDQNTFSGTYGRVEWLFESLDAPGGVPPGISIGFLPANLNPPEGVGGVTFTVAQKQNLAPGTLITNRASIVFDVNTPILTPVWTNRIAAIPNCCDDCVAPYPVCYTNTIYSGYNYLANNLCHGTNNTLQALLPNVPDGSTFMKWNKTSQAYSEVSTYVANDGWYNGDFTAYSTETLEPGAGFVLNNPGAPYDLTICGCLVECPPACLTNTTGFVLVGRLGVGPAYWTNLSSCPPVCGTIVYVWNPLTQAFTSYTYEASGWTPPLPPLGIGQSAFVKIGTDTNCAPCTNNLVINGSFETPNIGFNTVGYPATVPGWTSTDANLNPIGFELWSGSFGAMAPQEGNQHLEINSTDPDVTVSQVITNVSTNCPVRFCFWYTGRPGYVDNTFVAEVVGSGVAPVTNNPPVYTSALSWLQYCVEFVPTSTTLTIQFTGLSGSIPAGARIDNVTLMQCCTNTPCTEPLIVNCSTNKTVDCAATWLFDAPTASSLCCDTNITIAVLSTSTNGFCPKIATRIWQITDCLNNTATCTQTVTVVDSTAPVFATDCVTNVYSAGGNTSFVTPSPSFPRPALMARLQQAWGITSTRGFDECGFNQWFAHSFTNLPKCITAAYLEIRLKPCGDICGNDAMHLWFTGSANNNAVFSQYFGGGNVRPGLATNDWCSYGSNPQTFILDLSALPASGGGVANILPLLEANGFLDVTTQDDTGVDYVKLTVVSCCGSTSKTVECGSVWSFDAPIGAVDNCCTNPPITVLSTVTNGICPKIATRIWQAVDCCGNAVTHTQTVTMVDTTLPVIKGPGAITKYTCDSSMIVKYNVSAWDACSGTLTPVCTPPSGYNFPIGTTIVTCTATDACGNVATYTFPVTIVNQSIVTSTMLGLADCFKKPKENAPKSAQLLAAHPSVNWKKFDSKPVNRPFGLSFMGLPKNLTCATLEIRMKPNCSDISENDGIGIGLTSSNTTAWSSYIGGGNPSPGLTGNVWCDVGNCGQTFTLNLASMPNGGANLLPIINALNQVDIYVQDDTAVDYAKLTYCYCRTKPWWQGWEWDVINADVTHGDKFTVVKPVAPTNYSVTLSPGAAHGMHVGLSPLDLGSVSNASLTLSTHVIGDPANADSAVKLTGDGTGKVGLSLPSLSPGVTQVKLVLSLNGVVVSQSTLPASSGTNAIVIMEDGPMLRALTATETRLVEGTDGAMIVSLEAPRNIRECPMCPPMLADQITVVLVNPGSSPDAMLTSLTLAADGLDEIEIGETAMLIGDAWAQVVGDNAAVGDDQLTVTRQDTSATNRIGITIHLPLTNRVSLNLAALQNAPGMQTNGVLDVELFNLGSSGQDGVRVYNLGSSGQDGVELFNLGSSGQDGLAAPNLGSSGQDGVMIRTRFTETNSGWNINADFKALGSSQELYQVYKHGVQVASITFHGTPHVPVLPGVMSVADAGAKLFLHWPDAQIINLNGMDYVGNELRVAAVAPDLSLSGITVMNIGSSGQDGVSLSSVLTPAPHWWMQPLEDEGDELSIEWTGPAGGAVESAPTVTGPWTVVPTQSSYSATAPSPQSTNAPSAQFFRVRSN